VLNQLDKKKSKDKITKIESKGRQLDTKSMYNQIRYSRMVYVPFIHMKLFWCPACEPWMILDSYLLKIQME